MKSEEETPGHSSEQKKEDIEDEAICSACGYHVGGLLTCPRCGASVQKSSPIRLVKNIAIFGSIFGIIFLWIFTKYAHSPPKIEISRISEAMNNAIVTVEGRVTDINLNQSANRFRMVISQGPDELSLMSFNELDKFQKYFGNKFPPQFFDKVRVTSGLSIDSTFGASMFLSSPERLKLVGKWHEAPARRPASITEDDIGQYLLVYGTIRKVERPGKLRSITIAGGGETREFVVRDYQYKKLSKRLQQVLISPGYSIMAVVEVDQFRDKLQLNLANTETIAPTR